MTTTLAPAASATQTPPPSRRRRGGWRVPLRIARREARRAKGRSALVVALVMLPVLVVTAASTLLRTYHVTDVEALPRQMGTADAYVKLAGWEPAPGNSLVQSPDANSVTETDAMPAATDGLTGAEAVRAVLGEGTQIIELPSQSVTARVDERTSYIVLTEAPLSDPMLQGMVELRAGRLPAGPGEIAVTESLEDQGAVIGSTVDLGTYGEAQVVGLVRSARFAYEAWAAPGGLGVPFVAAEGDNWYSQWLVTTPGGVSWEDVLALNQHGLWSLSRAVVEDPPTDAELAADPRTAALVSQDMSSSDGNATAVAVGALLVVMVLLEVVLLAGPAFAVGASRQTRALGLLAAQGATRPHLRRVVMAQAVVLGGAAAVMGVVLGLLSVRLSYPLFLAGANGNLGPFEFAASDLVIVAAFGFVSALLAALLPARAAARLDPVRALAGRRPSPRRMRWHAPLGLALVAAGAGAAIVSARGQTPLALAASALLVVLGAVLLAPLAITGLARLTGRAGFATRYAARDMARNQLRTAPAVAAVTAVVAAAVALGIAGASDSAKSRAMYVPYGPAGDAMATVYGEEAGAVPTPVWEGLRAALVASTPDSTGTLIEAAPDIWSGNVAPGTPALTLNREEPTDHWSAAWAGDLLIGQEGLDLIAELLTSEQVQQAREALDNSTAVYLTNTPDPDRTLRIDKVVLEVDSTEEVLQSYSVPAISVRVPGTATPASAILPADFVAQAGVEPVVTAIRLDARQELDAQDQADLTEVATRFVDEQNAGLHANIRVETGWQNQDWVYLLILGAAAAALAIGGSLTAAKLALSDARADFATLGAVGAPPAVRRRIAGMYGAAIALLGAGLGAAVGFVPGIAACYPLTSQTWAAGRELIDVEGNALPDVFVVIPWTMVGALVIGLPLVVGLIVMLTTRSRLPMVQRIE